MGDQIVGTCEICKQDIKRYEVKYKVVLSVTDDDFSDILLDAIPFDIVKLYKEKDVLVFVNQKGKVEFHHLCHKGVPKFFEEMAAKAK